MQRMSPRPPSDPLEKLAWYLDQAFPIPGTRWRVGWDAILGLIPGVGEAVMMVLQACLVFAAVTRYRVPGVIAARMVVNVLIDSAFGSIPLVGDVFDVFFKANTRNVDLLREVRDTRAAGKPVSRLRHTFFLIAVGVSLLAVVAAAIATTVWVVRYLMTLLQS